MILISCFFDIEIIQTNNGIFIFRRNIQVTFLKIQVELCKPLKFQLKNFKIRER